MGKIKARWKKSLMSVALVLAMVLSPLGSITVKAKFYDLTCRVYDCYVNEDVVVYEMTDDAPVPIDGVYAPFSNSFSDGIVDLKEGHVYTFYTYCESVGKMNRKIFMRENYNGTLGNYMPISQSEEMVIYDSEMNPLDIVADSFYVLDTGDEDHELTLLEESSGVYSAIMPSVEAGTHSNWKIMVPNPEYTKVGCITYNVPEFTARGVSTVTVKVTPNGEGEPTIEAIPVSLHTHNWNTTVSGNQITAYCTESEGECDYYGVANARTLTLNVSDIQKGGTLTPVIEGDNALKEVLGITSTPEVSYSGVDANGTAYGPNTTAPTAIGTYQASVTIASKTITTEFAITKKKQSSEITVDTANIHYTYGDAIPQLSLTATPEEEPTPAYYYNTTNSTDGGRLWSSLQPGDLLPGTYYVYAKCPATAEYAEFVTIPVEFTVSTKTIEPSEVTANAVNVTYDTKEHGITVIPAVTLKNAVVKYGTVEGTYNLNESPKYEDAGDAAYTVYYQITADGCKPYTGSQTVTINRKNVNLKSENITITGEDDLIYNGSYLEPEVTLIDDDGNHIPASEYTVLYANNLEASTDTTEKENKPVVSITDQEGGNYDVNGSKIFAINKAAPTLSVSAVPAKTLGGDVFELEVAKLGESTPEFTSSNENVITVNEEGIVSIVGAGNATITVSMDESKNYDAKSVNVDITVKKKGATLEVSNLTYELTYGDADFSIGEITSDGESDVTFASSDENVVTVDRDGKVTIVGAGNATITLAMAESDNYEAVSKEVTVKIAPKVLTAAEVLLGDRVDYTGTEQTQTVKSVTVDGEAIEYEVTGNTETTAGVHTMTITFKGNYAGTITKTYVIFDKEKPTDAGSINVAVKEEMGAPKLEISSSKADLMDMLITADELAAIADGKTYDIWIETVNETNTISAETKNLLADGAAGYKLGIILDIKFFKKLSGTDSASIITSTAKDVQLAVTVPDELINHDANVERTYAIARNHEGKVDILTASFNANTKALSFGTNKFSDYAIIYKDTEKADTTAPESTVVEPDKPAESKPANTKPDAPATGDSFNPIMVVALMLASMAGFVGILVYHKKKEDEQ